MIELPTGIDLAQAMAIGTAGFTAALAIHRMEHNGQVPAKGPIVVTGATGGVGSIAIDLLAGRGFDVVAVSGKAEADDYLKALGATRILRRQEIDLGKRPMEATQWGGAIDSVGGEILTWLTRTVDLWGNIASIGLAGSHKLETTVMPLSCAASLLASIPPRRRATCGSSCGTPSTTCVPGILTSSSRHDRLRRSAGAFDAYLKGGVLGARS